ncbi:MAG: hypothetical protein ACXAB7_11265, partial [Candidatus Kariarchaeaceae archaeon]
MKYPKIILVGANKAKRILQTEMIETSISSKKFQSLFTDIHFLRFQGMNDQQGIQVWSMFGITPDYWGPSPTPWEEFFKEPDIVIMCLMVYQNNQFDTIPDSIFELQTAKGQIPYFMIFGCDDSTNDQVSGIESSEYANQLSGFFGQDMFYTEDVQIIIKRVRKL